MTFVNDGNADAGPDVHFWLSSSRKSIGARLIDHIRFPKISIYFVSDGIVLSHFETVDSIRLSSRGYYRIL